MGRYVKVIFLLLLCILMTGCDKKMPEIVFLYSTYELDEDWYETCVIDNQGNIYYSDTKKVYDYSMQDLADMCNEGTISEDLECVGTVEVEELQNMYNLYNDVVDNKYELTSDDMCVDTIVLEKFWCGSNYEKNGDVESVHIYRDGNTNYYPSDERAWDIVNWMNEVMGVETMTQPSK